MSEATKQFKSGHKYEENIVRLMFQDNAFAQQMVEVLDPKYFTEKHLDVISDAFFRWYKDHKGFPSVDTFVSEMLTRVTNEPMKVNIQRFLKGAEEPFKPADITHIRETSLEFCRKNHLMLALDKCLTAADDQKYNDVVSIIQKAVSAGSERNFGHIYKDELEERMRERDRKPVATPWQVLNDIIGGGISAGELGVILALTGVGKSHALVDLGAAAALAGLNVVHFTFELSEVRVGKRYDARLSGVAHDDLGNNRELVENVLANLPGSIRIKKYPNRQASVLTLQNYVSRLEAEGTKPDVLVVDYADIMQSGKSYENKRFEEEAVYEELRSFADELKIPIWTASQTNRSGMDVDVLTLKHIAECFAKANIADLFITMNRKKSGDYQALMAGNYETLGNMYVAKSRLGPDGIKFNCLVNTALSQIKCLAPGSPEEDEAMATHDLNLETDAQRIRKNLNTMRRQGPDEKSSLHLVHS